MNSDEYHNYSHFMKLWRIYHYIYQSQESSFLKYDNQFYGNKQKRSRARNRERERERVSTFISNLQNAVYPNIIQV